MRGILPEHPNVCSKRVIKTFLLFPKTLENQWVWLEFAEIEQIYNDVFGWIDVKFLPKKQQN